jgi:acetyl-CoA carboxylase biotin carboxylase subunit
VFSKVLIANRGEIAVRVIRACRELGVATVLAHSEADKDSLPFLLADETVCIGPAAADRSYLHIPNIVSAALITGCDAIHPGYGFLSENAYLADAAAQCGLTFIGPPPRVIETMGDKIAARMAMRKAGLPVTPGSDEPLANVDEAIDVARQIGYPVMLKAVAGGGGRGIRPIHDERTLVSQFALAQNEAQASFGRGSLYIERLVQNARHVEVQVMADNHGNVVWLGERDCSLQRRRQKILEEAPAPNLDDRIRRRLLAEAAKATKEVGYRNVGTLEFLMDDQSRYYFMEMNCRVQVEHGVTEMVTGVDIVKEQLRIAANERLSVRQQDVATRGHAIECRITSEDARNGFAPDSGRITAFVPPGGPGIRVDTHCFAGYFNPPYYDSLLSKVIAWGSDRREAIDRALRALRETRVEGVSTTTEYLIDLLDNVYVRRGEVTIDFVGQHHEGWRAGLEPARGH